MTKEKKGEIIKVTNSEEITDGTELKDPENVFNDLDIYHPLLEEGYIDKANKKQNFTIRQKKFVVAYLKNGRNCAKAVRQAGYLTDEARQQGYKLLKSDYIETLIDSLTTNFVTTTEQEYDRIRKGLLNELLKQAQEEINYNESENIVRIKAQMKAKSMDMLQKILDRQDDITRLESQEDDTSGLIERYIQQTEVIKEVKQIEEVTEIKQEGDE
jgi:phage terminase small subunit